MADTVSIDFLQYVVWLFFYLAAGLIFGILSKNLAQRTNRSPIGMFVLGFFLGVIGYLAARELCGVNKHKSFSLSSASKNKSTGRDLY